MRKLELGDLGLLSKAVGKLGIREDIIKLYQNMPTDEEETKLFETKLGASLILMVLENYWRAEEEVLSLISRLDGRTVKELKKVRPAELKAILKELFEDEEIQGFFS